MPLLEVKGSIETSPTLIGRVAVELVSGAFQHSHPRSIVRFGYCRQGDTPRVALGQTLPKGLLVHLNVGASFGE
jgi:hypothetical protein